MPSIAENLELIASDVRTGVPGGAAMSLAQRLARALKWEVQSARTQQKQLDLPFMEGPAEVTQAFLSDQPAVVFAGHGRADARTLLNSAALFAYHSSVEWGVVADSTESIVFNSHWVRNGNWFQLPAVPWGDVAANVDLFEAMTPKYISAGRIERIATSLYEPDAILLPVDDAFVERLDYWRSEVLKCTKCPEGIDAKVQTLFAQMFVLRAVEDRRLAPGVPSLQDALTSHDEADMSKLSALFESARDLIQSELFESFDLSAFPAWILNGIIKDLYKPSQLPMQDVRYNFQWIDADILGMAYEKYLSTLLVPTNTMASQLRLWHQPYREVERIAATRKASGAYYTPSFLVQYITEQCIEESLANRKDHELIPPRIIDFSCGSGSFLTSAVDSVIRRLREHDPARNWGRELINGKNIVGIDSDPRAVTFARLSLWLRLAEEPNPLPLPALGEVIIHGDSLSDAPWRKLPESYDIVLGNPPFLATGKGHTKDELAGRFQAAQGRFDYSYLFVELALQKLVPGGVLGLVIPNRLFRNKDASGIRSVLADQADLLTVVDFGTTEVFSGINSYVGVVRARKRNNGPARETVRYIEATDLHRRFMAAFLSAADGKTGPVRNGFLRGYCTTHPRSPGPWLFLSPSAKTARIRLGEAGEALSSMAGVYQGIKTGANDVFIVEMVADGGEISQVRDGFGDLHFLESALLRPVVFGSDIQRYDVVQPSRMLIYPYDGDAVLEEEAFRECYPHAFEYLGRYREFLAARASIIAGGLSWYALARRREEAWLENPKVITRDLVTEPSFAVDPVGGTYLVGGVAVVPADLDLIFPLLAYLNSKFAEAYLGAVTSSFRAGFRKIECQHLVEMPIPLVICEDEDLKEGLTQQVRNLLEAKRTDMIAAQRRYEDKVNKLLATSLRMAPGEIR